MGGGGQRGREVGRELVKIRLELFNYPVFLQVFGRKDTNQVIRFCSRHAIVRMIYNNPCAFQQLSTVMKDAQLVNKKTTAVSCHLILVE